MEIEELVAKIAAEKAIDRAAGQSALEKWMDSGPTAAEEAAFEAQLAALGSSERWMARSGQLSGGAAWVLRGRASETFKQALQASALQQLEHDEVRVRFAVSEALGALARIDGPSVLVSARPVVEASIEASLHRVTEDPPEQAPSATTPATADEQQPPRSEKRESSSSPQTPLASPPMSPRQRFGGSALLHDTMGWRFLESSFKCLQMMVVGCGPQFVTGGHYDDRLAQLLTLATAHTNRFVREIAYHTLDAIHQATLSGQLPRAELHAQLLHAGLGDNWSQVRYAAARAARSYYDAVSSADRLASYPVLLPPLCLNRRYVAEGVRNYSLTTWRQVVGDQGRALLEQTIAQVVAYDLAQAEADNHAVREAACACIAELASQLSPPVVAPYVGALLAALETCLRDESWPVRDAACVAAGRFVKGFAEECRPQLEVLWQAWERHLFDNIWSVREDSAVALGHALEAYGDTLAPRLWALLDEHALLALQQTPDSRILAGVASVTKFGVAAHRHDDEAHHNQTMYSCGSLAPKLKRGAGCMDHSFQRKVEPWEHSDGCVYLLRELARVRPRDAVSRLALLPKMLQGPEFDHKYLLRITVWNQLPEIVRNLGVDAAAPTFLDFADELRRDLRSPVRLVAAAATQSLSDLKSLARRNESFCLLEEMISF